MVFLRSRWFTALALAIILLIALGLRAYNVDWADGQLPHPDERSTVAFYAPTIRWPTAPGDLLDPRRSRLNPLWDVDAQQRRSFTYGHFPLYLMAAGGHLTVKLAPLAERLGLPEATVDRMRIANGSPGFAWVGRVLMALADTLTVFYMFLLGRRLYNRWAGLLAAALGAFTVLQIQLAHFFAVDPISTTFTVAAVYHSVRLVDTGRWRQALLAGAMAALAIASKFSAAPILAAPVVAGAILVWRQNQQSPQERAAQTPGWLLAAGALALAALVFTLTSPFVLLDFENFRKAVIDEQGAMVRGVADFPFTRQYRGTAPYFYFIAETVQWGMGWPLGIAGWLAFAWVIVKAAARRASAGEWIMLSWLIPYFGITGSFLAKFNRYMAPVVPFLTILAAGMLWALARRSVFSGQYSVFSGQYSVFSDQGAGETRARGGERRYALFAAIILLPTMLWALAFVNGVYGREHTFITASTWMYENVPDGSVWITEHWEEGLPLLLPIPGGSPGAHGWRNLVMPMYEEDNEAKFQTLKQNMTEGDYYVLATKRMYGALPRLPERYPLSIRFYDLLFSGQLGYELAAEFTAYPSLFGIDIPDQNADESFWVYDHPRVLIYKKVRDLSESEWQALLGGSWSTAIPGYTGQRPQDRGRAPTGEAAAGPTLLLDQPVGSLPDVGRVAWAPWRDSSLLSLLVWWLALLAINLLTWPIAFSIFSGLRDRGYGFNRGLGLLVLAWIPWMLSASRWLINNLLPLLIALILLAALAAALWRRNRAEMRAFLAAHRTLLLWSEGLFSAAFLFFVGIRLLNPDLWQPWTGGEKYMEFAFLNAVLKTPYFPPYDPYFAGGIMNYYYYGYQILAGLIKLTGVRPTIAFNLAIPTLFALTAAGVFSLVYSLVPRSRQIGGPWWRRGLAAGLAGVFFVTLMANLEGGLILLRQVAERGDSAFTSNLPGLQGLVRTLAGLAKLLAGDLQLPAYDFWTPSRVLPFTINEFPFWSFLFADLHPHMIGIPFTLLFLALSFNLLSSYGRRWDVDGRPEGALALFALPLTLGAIGAINTWDLPTYLGVGVLAWGLREWKGFGRLRLAPTLLFVAGLAALSYLLYLPFYSNYTTVFETGVGLTYIQTDLAVWLRMWGLFLFLALSYTLIELTHAPGDVPVLRWLAAFLRYFDRAPRFLDHAGAFLRPAWTLSTGQAWVGISLLLAAGLAWLGYGVLALLILPLSFTALFLFRRAATAEAQFRALLFFTGLLVLVGVEVFYLKDFLCGCGQGLFNRQHGDYYRMNTLFKFYIQVWVLLGVGMAAALPALRDAIDRWRRGWRAAWYILLGLMLALSFVFLLLGTANRVDNRFPGARPPRTTLDGMAFMSVGQYTWPDQNYPIDLRHDYEAIRWLQEHVTGSPVLAEAPASWYPVNGQNAGYDYYRAGGLRVTSLTGLPGFLGQHQGEQRFGYQTGPREQIGREFWETTDIARLRQIIVELDVAYIYVGQLERILFTPDQLAKFPALVDLGQAEVIFQNQGVTIYRLVS